MSLTVYRKQLLLGGGATALDGIDGAILLNLDECTVYQSGVAYTYVLNATSGAADDGLNTIAPDTNPGTKRWILNKSYMLMTDDEVVAMSSKAPKANPVFTGNVMGSGANGVFASIDPTNAGVAYTGGKGSTLLNDNQSITITIESNSGIMLLLIYAAVSGAGAIFGISATSATILKLMDDQSAFEITNTDTGKTCVFKSANSGVITIKNYTNAAQFYQINVQGAVIASATAPA